MIVDFFGGVTALEPEFEYSTGYIGSVEVAGGVDGLSYRFLYRRLGRSVNEFQSHFGLTFVGDLAST